MSDKMHYSAGDYEFRNELIGKRIVEITAERMRLDDGTILIIEDGGDCCAWFAGEFKALSLSDNAITRVEAEDVPENDEDQLFTIHIYSAHEQLAVVDVQGDPSSGYYGSSINLRVTKE